MGAAQRGGPLRVGIVCPYSLDVPGGVQAHVIGLARALRAAGHSVHVLAPADGATPLPDFVTPAGRALGVPYNGSVARVTFGPVSYARVRRWLAEHHFDVLHLHEPTTVSLSAIALMVADGPIVVTFHTATERSRALSALGGVIRPLLEKVTARIAVSPHARRVQVQHLGGDAVEIPNGVDVAAHADGPLLPGYPRAGGTVGFLGRFDEPRKGLPVLLEAMRTVVRMHPGARLLIAGRGDADEVRGLIGDDLRAHVALLGELTEADKAAFLRSVDIYCAPNLLGESFGVVLIEALAAGAPIVASDLDAFVRVLEDGEAGVVVRRGDPTALADALCGLLADPARMAELSARGARAAAVYDWDVLARRILAVYEMVLPPGGGEVTAGEDDPEFPSVPPARMQARTARHRGAQH
jgi:phosphatidyl-myo-inositol alpha-mannosyltransferase